MTLFVPGDLVIVFRNPKHLCAWDEEVYPGASGVVTSMPYKPPIAELSVSYWSYCVDVRLPSSTRRIAVLILRKILPPPDEIQQETLDELYS
jgi:hypothetical protein